MIKWMSYGYTGGGTWEAHKGTVHFKRSDNIVKIDRLLQGKPSLMGGE